MSLIEIMIVVAIIAMVSGGVAVAAVRSANAAKLKTAETGARTVRQAAQTYAVTEDSSTCPTTEALVASQFLDDGASAKDPWDSEYHVQCTERGVFVSSPGPDRKAKTEDDINVPKKID